MISDFFLTTFKEHLKEIGLYRSIRAVQYGIPTSRFYFFCLLELYNPDTGIFFTPGCELGFALHEIYKVWGLPIGEIPYDEYVSTEEELSLLTTRHTLIYDTYWELLCHYHIWTQITDSRNNGVKQKAWADYLLPNFNEDNSDFTHLSTVFDQEIEDRIAYFGTNAYITESDEDISRDSSSFDSFHYQVYISYQIQLYW